MSKRNHLHQIKALNLTAILLLLLNSSVLAKVTLPEIFANDMVLQQDKRVSIWGWADAGEKIVISFAGQTVMTRADKNGRWIVKPSPLKAGGPYKMTIKGKKNKIKLKNVMIGEVWLCSGQSNMEWSLKKLGTYTEEIRKADYPNLRLFHIPKKTSNEPHDSVNAAWEICSPNSVENFSGTGYFFGKYLQKELGVTVALIQSAWGGTRIEPWIPPAVYNKDWNYPNDNAKQQPSVTYNGMIHPIIPFTIRGAIWYQGESNCIQKDRMLYYDKFETMVSSWRKLWAQGDFPFYFVQLAPYDYTPKQKLASDELAYFWETQTKCLNIPNTGMAVTMDIGNVKDIHPKNKHELGKRLALWALAKDYGKDNIVYSGPLYKSMKVEADKIRISFDHTGSGLTANDSKELTWFTIAGNDKVFHPATAVIDADTVVVSSEQVKEPAAVRFAWEQSALPNLSNKDALPASPFRTDKWE